MKFFRNGALLLAFSLLAGCSGSKGMGLFQLQDQFETLGRTAAHAQHCNVPVNITDIEAQLTRFAAGHGATADEQQSLVSYFTVALENESRYLPNQACGADEREKADAALRDQLAALR